MLETSLDAFIPFANAELFTAVIESNNPEVSLAAVNKLGKFAASADLLSLLDADERKIRMAAIRALAGQSDMGVLQRILEAFEKEKDDEVRKLYQDLHWVTREGLGGRS